MTEFFRRLPLDGLFNARELGGFTSKFGSTTKYGRFIRSEVPKSLSERDVKFLKDYGVGTEMDFRGPVETNRIASVLKDEDFITYINCPTFNEQVSFSSREKRVEPHTFVKWSEKYIEMLTENADWVRRTMEEIEKAPGAVLFHCATGKDRTGIIAALLLSIAGVDETDIIADYSVSQIYMRPVYIELTKRMPGYEEGSEIDLSSAFFKTSPENMEETLQFIYDNHGTCEQYLKDIGVSDKTIENVRKRLLD